MQMLKKEAIVAFVRVGRDVQPRSRGVPYVPFFVVFVSRDSCVVTSSEVF